jgi:predicted dehydrogenase
MTDIAIAGAGNAAEMHALALEQVEGADLVAAASRTESTGEAFADEFDCDWYPDVGEMLERSGADVLHVCTPSGAHRDPTLTATEHGVDVLCEKPLEITTGRVDEMAAAAEEAGVLLGGVFQQRFNPVVRTVQEAAAGGRFGALSVANAYVPWWRDDDYYSGSWKGTKALDGGGALMNQSIHGVDAIQWLAAAAAGIDREHNPVAEVSAYTDTLAHDPDDVEVEDTAVVALRYRSGALGQLLGTTSMYPGSLKRLQVAGRDGTATVEEDELVTWQFREEREDDAATREEFTTTETGGGASDPMDIDVSNHARNIEAFLAAREGDGEFLLDAREARKAVAIIEAVYESADTGGPVSLE